MITQGLPRLSRRYGGAQAHRDDMFPLGGACRDDCKATVRYRDHFPGVTRGRTLKGSRL
ncbi:hypothetical protein GCM10018785_17810 [Streptomyces longispororuber]|uniref:Uncharacterized protein n=1 Tax=Streptomyces longispororuber TaxID=68230 RepID=A0A918ZFF3_9ACTN|nr:hypothetical protein GCM10018785_17810 [Streptomyces longispororuber]